MNKEGESQSGSIPAVGAGEGERNGGFWSSYLTRMNQEGQWDCWEGFLEIKQNSLL